MFRSTSSETERVRPSEIFKAVHLTSAYDTCTRGSTGAIWISLTGRITSVMDFNDTGTSLPDRN